MKTFFVYLLRSICFFLCSFAALHAQVTATGDFTPTPASTPTWVVGGSLTIGNTGTGTLTIDGGGSSVSNTFGILGFLSGSNGTATVSGGTWTNSTGLFVGDSGTGVLNLSSGSISNTAGYLGNFAGSNGTANVSGGAWTNSSVLTVGDRGTGVLNLSSGSVSNNVGYLGRYADSSGTATVSGGAWTNSSVLTIGDVGTGVLNLSSGSVSSTEVMVGDFVGGVGTINLTGGILSTGQVGEGLGTGAVIFNGGTLRLTGAQAALFTDFETSDVTLATGGGTIDTQGFTAASSYVLSGTGSLTKQGSGKLNLTAANTYTGGTSVSNGTLMVNNTTGSGTGTGAVTVTTGGTLGGSGTVAGATTIASGAFLAPGNSPGILSFDNTLLLAGTVNFELNGLARGTQYDGINVTGALTYGGTAELLFGSAFIPQNTTTTFNLFNLTTQTSTFDSLTSASIYNFILNSGNAFSATDQLGNAWSFNHATGDLSVVAIPEPSTFALLFVGLGFLFFLYRSDGRWGWFGVLGFGFWVLGFGFWVLGFGLGFGVWGLGFWVLG